MLSRSPVGARKPPFFFTYSRRPRPPSRRGGCRPTTPTRGISGGGEGATRRRLLAPTRRRRRWPTWPPRQTCRGHHRRHSPRPHTRRRRQPRHVRNAPPAADCHAPQQPPSGRRFTGSASTAPKPSTPDQLKGNLLHRAPPPGGWRGWHRLVARGRSRHGHPAIGGGGARRPRLRCGGE